MANKYFETVLKRGTDALPILVRNALRFKASSTPPLFIEELGKKKGDTIHYQRPVRYLVKDGPGITADAGGYQDMDEPDDSATLEFRKVIPMKISSQDATLNLRQFTQKHFVPAAIAMANDCDRQMGIKLAQNVWNSVGTPGTDPSTLRHLLDAQVKLRDGATPEDMMVSAIVDQTASANFADNLKGALNPNVTEEAIRRGQMGTLAGFDVKWTQNIHRHTVGSHGGTPLVNGAAQVATGDNAKNATVPMDLVTDGWTNSTAVLNQGDVFTLAGVFAVNPITKATLTTLQQFVVNADVTSDGSGNATISITPAIIADGPQQTVSAAPADGAAITVMGTAGSTYAQNIVMHPRAIELITVPLELPDAPFAAQATAEGISVRVVKDYDIDADEMLYRLDILYAAKVTYPEFATRLWGG